MFTICVIFKIGSCDVFACQSEIYIRSDSISATLVPYINSNKLRCLFRFDYSKYEINSAKILLSFEYRGNHAKMSSMNKGTFSSFKSSAKPNISVTSSSVTKSFAP